jgi:transposase
MSERPEEDAKAQALRRQRVLNPKPETVTDERFQADEFFDSRDLVQVKYEMVRRVREEGVTATEASKRFGFSRPTFYEVRRALEAEGLAGLVPKPPGPKGAHKLTEEVMEFVEGLRESAPGLGSEELARRIEERFGRSVHPRSIERALERREKKRRGTG